MVKLLSESEKPSDKTDLGVAIHIYTDSGEVKAIWSNSMIGVSEYTPEGAWKTVSPTDSRLVELQDYSMYEVDWANEDDFNEDGSSKALEMYKNGTLTEDYVIKNSKFLRNPVADES